jgi:polyhydroxybutyrate depolymerase
MAHRLAGDAAAGVAAIVSLAGAQWLDSTRCAPSQPVSVAQVHGTDDQVIAYAGGSIPPPYPGAVETVTRWQVYDGCSPGLVDAVAALDLVPDLPGSETVRQKFAGCPSGIGVELWTIEGGPHIPVFDPSWPDEVWSFLSAHPKP